MGHVGLIMKAPHGVKRSWKNIVEMKKKFVPPGVELLRLNIPVLNPGKGHETDVDPSSTVSSTGPVANTITEVRS